MSMPLGTAAACGLLALSLMAASAAQAAPKASPAELEAQNARSQALMMVTQSDVRRLMRSNRLLARLAAYRRPAGRVLRRWGWIK